MRSIASVESSFNPLAIGVVGGKLQRQPANLDEALATARMLRDSGFDYSVGLVQINQKNFAPFGLTLETAFDPCANLRVGSLIYEDCLKRAGGSVNPFGDALSCYYSGNFTTGYAAGYVAKVQAAYTPRSGGGSTSAIPVIVKVRANATPRTRPRPVKAAEPLFVTVHQDPGNHVAEISGDSSPPKRPDTALIF